MAIAKGKILITHDELMARLGLPDGVEIVSLEYSMGEHLELHIASSTPIDGFTIDTINWKHIRRNCITSDDTVGMKNITDRNKDLCVCGVNLGIVTKYNNDTSERIAVCAICEKPKK